MHTKFEELCVGPYIIENIMFFNSYMLKYMKGKMLMLLVNGKHLKCFFTLNFLISFYIIFIYLVFICLPIDSISQWMEASGHEDYGLLTTHKELSSQSWSQLLISFVVSEFSFPILYSRIIFSLSFPSSTHPLISLFLLSYLIFLSCD